MRLQNKTMQWLKNKKNNKYLIICLLCGILLMVMPYKSTQEIVSVAAEKTFSLHDEEKRLELTLTSIEGVGACKVLLSVHNGAESVLAKDEGTTVVLSGTGQEDTVTVMTKYPDFQGAVIVAVGAGDAHVRYDILSAVMAYTGLGSNKITICPMES